MSASLIKSNGQSLGQPFAVFSLPEDVGISSSLKGMGITNTDPESEAARIIDEARALAVQIEREARERMEGLIQAEIQNAIASVINPWRDQFQRSLTELTALRSEIVQQAEAELVRLALEVAKKVIHREVTTDHQIVLDLARVGLSRIPNRTPATIHLHPDDHAYFEINRDQIESGHALTLVVDRSIGRGGCVIHTELGEVDATIEQQFAEIQEVFLAS